MKIKKLLLVFVFGLSALTSFGQFVSLDISQQVRRDTERRQLTSDRDDIRKSTTVSKRITITVKSSKSLDLIVCLFYSSGGDIQKEFFVDRVSSSKPFQKTFMPPIASEEEVKIAFAKYGWGKDYKRKSGDSKIMTCFCVFNKRTGKFLGMKSTSPQIENTVKSYFADDIKSFVLQNKGDR